MPTETNEVKATYLNVMSDGKFHQKVDEGTPGAVLREGELKDGTKYSKWELLSEEITGTIKGVDTFDGGYGKNLNLRMDVHGEDVSVSFSTLSDFGKDMLHKVLSLNLNLPVTLTPFIEPTAKVNKNGEVISRKGVKVIQNNQEIYSHFQKWDKELGRFIPQNGMPEGPVAKPGKKVSPDEWKMYFMAARIFMIDAVETHFKVGSSEVDKKFNA